MGTTVVNRALDPNAFSPFLNLLNNGGMEVWQRGISFSNPSINAYTADKWQVSLIGSPTFTISQESSIIDGKGSYSLKLNVTAVGGATVCRIVGFVENASAYAGLTVSASARIKCNVANTAKIRLRDSIFNTPSDYHTGDNTWQTLTATQTVYSATSQLYLEIGMISSDVNVATIYIDNVMLCVGSQSLSFVPLQPADNFSRCLRYCQKFGGGAINQDVAIGIALSTSACEFPIHYFVPMAAVPTATVFSSTNWKTGNPAGGLVVIGALGFAAESNHSGYFAGSSVSGSPLTAFHAAELFSSTTSEYLLLEVL